MNVQISVDLGQSRPEFLTKEIMTIQRQVINSYEVLVKFTIEIMMFT